MDNDQKKALLALARNTITKSLLPDTVSVSIDESKLDQYLGAFVTLHIGQSLRGCIGYVLGFQPLYKSIQDLAISAAFKDSRFKPLSVGELNKVDIEISVLSEPSKIEDISQIVIGKHGLIIACGSHKGLLLPQVAVEHGWDRAEFFFHACHKAGFNPAYFKKEDLSIQVFEAEIFSESKM